MKTAVVVVDMINEHLKKSYFLSEPEIQDVSYEKLQIPALSRSSYDA